MKLHRKRVPREPEEGLHDQTRVLEGLEHRYERLARGGMSVLGALALVFAFMAVSGKPSVTSVRVNNAISVVTAVSLSVGVGYFLVSMRSLRQEIGKRRVITLPARAERLELIRRVGELSAVLDASRVLESASSLRDLCTRLATESESLASGDAALVVLRSHEALSVVAATDPRDRDDEALEAQCQGWTTFLEDGGLPLLATGETAIREAFGTGPLATRYGSAMEVPLLANGGLIGLVVVLRKVGSDAGFDADGLQAVGLLTDVASHLILLRRMNVRMRRTNRRLVDSLQELKLAQDQLLQSEKLRAVGELVSGVAHELNNPLTSLLGFAQLLTLNNSVATDAEKKWVDEIQREASRCSMILQNLLGFARKSATGKVYVPTGAIVSETIALKSYDLRSAKVEARNEVPDSVPVAALDRQDLQQVLLNLINNAVFAMRHAAQRILRISGRTEGDTIVLEVSDTGCGIEQDQIDRIFEPFFSTKARGDSIGIGLTTCRRILAGCGGTISVRSEVGRGTTFQLRVPVVRELAVV